MLDCKDIISTDNGRLESQVDFRVHFYRLFNPFHFIQHLHPAFRTADGFFTVKGAQLLDDRFLMADFLLLI